MRIKATLTSTRAFIKTDLTQELIITETFIESLPIAMEEDGYGYQVIGQCAVTIDTGLEATGNGEG